MGVITDSRDSICSESHNTHPAPHPRKGASDRDRQFAGLSSGQTVRFCPSCDHRPNLKSWVGAGAAPHARARPRRRGTAAPTGRRRRRSQAASPPCRAAPPATSAAGCRPPRARMQDAGSGGRRCRAVSHRPATSRAAGGPLARAPRRGLDSRASRRPRR
jgi:hypothetical protein